MTTAARQRAPNLRAVQRPPEAGEADPEEEEEEEVGQQQEARQLEQEEEVDSSGSLTS